MTRNLFQRAADWLTAQPRGPIKTVRVWRLWADCAACGNKGCKACAGKGNFCEATIEELREALAASGPYR